MTLIFGLASRHRILQVSDRQLTSIDEVTGVRTSVKAPATKSVVFENRAIFGYTGLSKLEGRRTDLWIADIISEVRDGDIMRAMELVRVSLERAFRPFRVRSPVYHAVLVSGFRPLGDGGLQAFNASIANSPDERNPGRTFLGEIYDVPPGQMTLTQRPGWLTENAFTALNRSLGRAGEHGNTMSAGTDLLVRAIRDVAADHMEVGADLISVSMPAPRDAALGEVWAGLGRPEGPGVRYEYFSPDQDSTHFGPTMVMNGMIFRDVVESHSETET